MNAPWKGYPEKHGRCIRTAVTVISVPGPSDTHCHTRHCTLHTAPAPHCTELHCTALHWTLVAGALRAARRPLGILPRGGEASLRGGVASRHTLLATLHIDQTLKLFELHVKQYFAMYANVISDLYK